MPALPEFFDGPFVRDDDEGLFSRDIYGQLVRLDSPTESDYQVTVTLQIDGQSVIVPLAEPLCDADGNIVLDLEGRTTPRYTTIYDAARKLYVKQPGDETKIPIPILCHQSHMKPVAVCRLCVVQIYGQKGGERKPERKLLPACQHQVKEGMEVFTMKAPGKDGDGVRQTVKVLTELLAADHLKPVKTVGASREFDDFNELATIQKKLDKIDKIDKIDKLVKLKKVGCVANPTRFQIKEFSRLAPAAAPQVARRDFDASSPVFVVDHSACILCDRCVRACNEVRENNVIGRTGKGATTGIGFDLNDPMGESSCVMCGECMVSCPTSAITFKYDVKVDILAKDPSAEVVSVADLTSDPLFAGIPPKFLLWQKGLVIRRQVRAGQTLCRQGEPGNTAFIIRRGKLEVTVYPSIPAKGVRGGIFGRHQRPVFREELSPVDLIVGEMSCITGMPRAANVVALEDGEVWEVRRNVLDRLMRLPSLRERFGNEYRNRTLELTLQGTDLFKEINPTEYCGIVDYLRDRLTSVRVKSGQTLFQQDDLAKDLFLIRLGHVRISVSRHGQEAKVVSSGPGAILGEIGLLALSEEDAGKSPDKIDQMLLAELERAGGNASRIFPAGRRTATCTALSPLDLACLNRTDFLEMVRRFPTLRQRVIKQALARLHSDGRGNQFLDEFVAQGLYEARSVLVLDMDLCTRCDECTKGCVEQHGVESHGTPVTRLLRDGMRFDKYLVATSCRSCTHAHCMVGCPVDSIHRGRHLQIVIEDHCIGCGLCAENCPYGSIFMVPNQRRRIDAPDPDRPGETRRVAQPKAVTCDLCDAGGERSSPQPRCVAACPHDAAHRMTGDDLLNRLPPGNSRIG